MFGTAVVQDFERGEGVSSRVVPRKRYLSSVARIPPDVRSECCPRAVRDQHRGLLVLPTGFYWNQVESFLRNVAFQLVVAPGCESAVGKRQLYSQFHDDYVNGRNISNRAAVVQRDSPGAEAELALHEIAHLALCHDTDPANPGPMGRETVVDLTEAEWEALRNNLRNIHDATGIDVVSHRCLIEDYLDGTAT